uniref:Metalloendopeptidase n=1 Tax=Parastrongyloides trichosuri TaxID=131310 RepID=A0A0N5A4T3_PARTI
INCTEAQGYSKRETESQNHIKYDVKSSDNEEDVKKVLDHISSLTCIQFDKSTTSLTKTKKITFGSKIQNECYKQFSCLLKQAIVKMGLFNVHRRQDRDKYVTIKKENYDPSDEKYFQISESNLPGIYQTGYDFGSIMHAKDTFKSINNKSTIEPKI